MVPILLLPIVIASLALAVVALLNATRPCAKTVRVAAAAKVRLHKSDFMTLCGDISVVQANARPHPFLRRKSNITAALRPASASVEGSGIVPTENPGKIVLLAGPGGMLAYVAKS